MRTLIVGVGALGGVIAARLTATGTRLSLATRSTSSAAALKASGLRLTGVGGSASVDVTDVAPVAEYLRRRELFELIVIATKAQDAIGVAPMASHLLAPGGTLLPIQNGGVSRILADQLGDDRVLGGLSNLGATMVAPGVYEQRNAGHLLIGELGGRDNERAERVRRWLGRAVEVRVTANLWGAVWSKVIVNCSVTTLGAIAARTMREYIPSGDGRALFERTYDEALSVALASGARPETMLVAPIPPGWTGRSTSSEAYEVWIGQVLTAYGDLKPSMLQDFERGRETEIDFINGYVVDVGRRHSVPTPTNEAIVDVVHAITRRELVPSPALLTQILHT